MCLSLVFFTYWVINYLRRTVVKTVAYPEGRVRRLLTFQLSIHYVTKHS